MLEKEKVLNSEINQEFEKAKMSEEFNYLNEAEEEEYSLNNIFSHTNQMYSIVPDEGGVVNLNLIDGRAS